MITFSHLSEANRLSAKTGTSFPKTGTGSVVNLFIDETAVALRPQQQWPDLQKETVTDQPKSLSEDLDIYNTKDETISAFGRWLVACSLAHGWWWRVSRDLHCLPLSLPPTMALSH